jgi:hypothetical protein
VSCDVLSSPGDPWDVGSSGPDASSPGGCVVVVSPVGSVGSVDVSSVESADVSSVGAGASGAGSTVVSWLVSSVVVSVAFEFVVVVVVELGSGVTWAPASGEAPVAIMRLAAAVRMANRLVCPIVLEPPLRFG